MAYRYLTPNLTGGVASKDILARVDLEKYATFLKQCKNGIVKPYGGVYKRNGTIYIDELTDQGNIRLFAFKQADVDYLLEFTDKHLTVRQQGGVVSEVDSPFTSDDLPNLKVTQSANTMFVCSGRLPIMEIRNNNGTFTIGKLKIPIPPFDELQDGVNFSISNSTGDATLSSDVDFFDASTEAWGVKILQRVATKIEDVTLSGQQTLGPVTLYKDARIIISGEWSGNVILQYSSWSSQFQTIGTYTSNGTIYSPASISANYRALITVATGQVAVKMISENYSGGSGGEGD